jgi:tRNA pseudouridine55 synthase
MFLAVDKPKWITSFDVIRRLKRQFPKKTKIGHSGTLDPMATGLLIIAVDKDTKRLQEFLGADKSYETTIDFSKMSDTWDMDYWELYEEYAISEQWQSIWITKNNIFIPAPSIEQIQEKINTLIPSAILPLTPFSAKKKDGKKLYELARAGVEVNESREMRVNNYEIVDYSFPTLTLKIDVWSGTYIRSIGYRLGQEFALGGILTSLRRTKVAAIDINTLILDQTVENINYTQVTL